MMATGSYFIATGIFMVLIFCQTRAETKKKLKLSCIVKKKNETSILTIDLLQTLNIFARVFDT